MSNISVNYVKVVKHIEPKPEGEFSVVEVQDSFVYKGKVVQVPQQPLYVDNHVIGLGDIILFAKYSPDTQEIEEKGEKFKYVKTTDILEVL